MNETLTGVLVVNKPAGMTSHDVVNVARRLFATRRVGHTGTLDPMATGVLALLLGPATRLSRFVTGSDKVYRAVIRFGVTTDTYDAEGEVMERCPVALERAEIEQALDQFRGETLQVPPMYSAIKVKGRKLYELARAGEEVEREARSVTFHRLDIVAWQAPELTLDVHCSAGTYVRSLAHDLGQALGCGAHLRALTRTASGAFTLDDTHSLETLHALHEAGQVTQALLPPQAALAEMPAVKLDADQEQAVRHGQTIPLPDAPQAEYLQAHDAGHHLVAVMIPVAPGQWRPKVVLPP